MVERPVRHTEDEEEVERTQDLPDEKVHATGSLDDHRPRPVAVLQLVGLAITQAPLLFFGPDYVADPVPVVVHTDTDLILLIEDVGHIPVDKIRMKSTLLLIQHEDLAFLGDYAHLLVVIHDVEISCLGNAGHEIEVELPLVLGVPNIGGSLTRR